MKTTQLCLLWLLCLLCRPLLSTGQGGMADQNYLFEHFSPQKGLSQGSGYAIASYNNFMWFGTQDGLNRFDGYTYKVYRTGENQAIRDNFIQCLLADSRGRFWVGTVRGIDLYNKDRDDFVAVSKAFAIPATHPVNNLAVRRLIEDREGMVWMMTDERGVYRFNPATGHIAGFLERDNSLVDITLAADGTVWITSDNDAYFYDAARACLQPVNLKKTLGLPTATIFRAVVGDAEGNIWVGTYEQGVFVVKPRGATRMIRVADVVHYEKGSSLRSLGGNQISSLFRDKSNRIWVGTRTEGISLFSPRTRTFVHFRNHENRTRSLASNYVLSFFEDRQDNIWVGLSGEGIDKIDPRKAPFRLIQRDSEQLPGNTLADNMVYKVLAVSDKLYIGTQAGGLSVYSLPTGTLQTFLPQPANPASILHNQVHDIVANSARNLWLATGRGLCYYEANTQRFTSYLQVGQPTLLYLYALALPGNGRELWAGGQRGIDRFDVTTRRWIPWTGIPEMEAISNYVVRLIYEDSRHNVWLGTLGHGLLCYNPQTRQVTSFDQKNGVSCHNIRSLKEIGNTLWIGTDCGLFTLDMTTSTVTAQFTERDGLPNEVIYGILSDADNYLWLSSNKGLTRFWPGGAGRPRSVKNYGVNDGLQSDEFNTNATSQHPDGTLFFGGVKGITYFRPRELMPNRFVPPVRLTSIRVLDSLYAPNQAEIRLTHKQNFIDFMFVAFSFSNTEKNTYAYRLDGINADWVRSGTRNFASYTNLPAGTYTFRVKGSNDDGLENPVEASIRVVITPVFYQTWWFRLLLGLLVLAFVWLAYRNHLSFRTVRAKLEKEEAIRQQKEAELKEASARFQQRISETEMAALRAQMNPHFIFNCLNSIQFFTAQKDIERASDYLTKFSRLIRMVLENSRSERVTLHNELETLRLFMDMEMMRFGKKIRYVIDLDEQIDTEAIEIPPLLLQPFVENAIWHGLMHKDEGGTVLVSVQQPTADRLRIMITDDGVGRAKAAEYKSKSATHNKSFGMKITAERIELINQMYHTNTQVAITDLVDECGRATGTKVIVDIPL